MKELYLNEDYETTSRVAGDTTSTWDSSALNSSNWQAQWIDKDKEIQELRVKIATLEKLLAEHIILGHGDANI